MRLGGKNRQRANTLVRGKALRRLVAWLLFIGLFALPAAAGVEVYRQAGRYNLRGGQRAEGPSQEIIALNSLDDPDLIGVGMQLKVPRPARSASGGNPEELELMAKVIYAEARGEPELGQLAVARVIVNRIATLVFRTQSLR